MAWIPGGTFAMGSAEYYPEERPVRDVAIDGFWMDVGPVTVSAFRRFVRETAYRTVAERALDPELYPGVAASALVPGSVVFQGTSGPVDLHDPLAWWSYVPGARWDRPEGPRSTVYTRGLHPVTHVAYEDAAAYAHWAGKALPGEAEWERAARGGLERAPFAWGDELLPGGRHLANWWQGEFPWRNLELDGWPRTSPVGSFPANGFGLHDMCGNVWEWTVDPAPASPPAGGGPACCGPPAPERIPRRVIKGGSHLCAPSYCLRFRPAARQFEAVDTSTSHLGFRCVMRA
jgi:formylglycine-generating enzyme required for sulfatase activity